jgi:molybdate transport repressor ModE-like protein
MRCMAPGRRSVDYRIDPFDLHLFAAVLEHGSITAAAAATSLSLAAASARIKALESSVGAKLLDRSKAGASPTDAGRALARHGRHVLSVLEGLHAEMASFGRGLRGTVRMLCNTAALSEELPPRLGRFLLRHPDLDVDVQELPSDAVLDGLRATPCSTACAAASATSASWPTTSTRPA